MTTNKEQTAQLDAALGAKGGDWAQLIAIAREHAKMIPEFKAELTSLRRKLAGTQTALNRAQAGSTKVLNRLLPVYDALGLTMKNTGQEGMLRVLKGKLEQSAERLASTPATKPADDFVIADLRVGTILKALGLPPDVSDKDVADKLVELSDQALAGKQIVARFQTLLGLPENEPLDVVYANLKEKINAAESWSRWCGLAQMLDSALGMPFGDGADDRVSRVQALVTEARDVRTSLNLPAGQAVSIAVQGLVKFVDDVRNTLALPANATVDEISERFRAVCLEAGDYGEVRETLHLPPGTEIAAVVACIEGLYKSAGAKPGLFQTAMAAVLETLDMTMDASIDDVVREIELLHAGAARNDCNCSVLLEGMNAIRAALCLPGTANASNVVDMINLRLAVEQSHEADVASCRQQTHECEEHNAQLIEDAERAREKLAVVEERLDETVLHLGSTQNDLAELQRAATKLAVLATTIGDVGQKVLDHYVGK
jgi:hypothetical protein